MASQLHVGATERRQQAQHEQLRRATSSPERV